jgi:serine/threonine-protein kinase
MGMRPTAPGPVSVETERIEQGPPLPPYEEPPPSRELWPWLLVLLVLVLAGAAAAWFATRESRTGTARQATTVTTVAAQTSTVPKPLGGKVVVPALAGMKAPKALAELKRRGLQGTVNSVFTKDPKGVVSSQQPQPGAKLAKDGTVTLNVSKGAKPVAVPDLVGQPRDQAVKILETQGFKPDVNEVPSDELRDTVIAQHPKGGTKRPPGSGVLLNVSEGTHKPAKSKSKAKEKPKAKPESVAVTVPNVIGLSLGAARAQLRSVGLVSEIQRVPSREPKNTVVAQSPRSGTAAERRDHVLLNVSLGPATATTPRENKSQLQATVPSVVGEDQETARADLQSAGFTVAVVYQDTTDPTQDGLVFDQAPVGGTRAAANSKVTIYVNRYTSQ